MTTKPQTPAQRVANPVWLRDQIRSLIKGCKENIAEDQARARVAYDRNRRRYLGRIENCLHWKQQLERILRGKTFMEEIAKDLSEGTSP